MTTTRIPQAFAQDGTRTPIETTRSDGVVNLDQGYTDDYSRELGVDPSAKAVERDSMNWLLWLLSSNVKDWQEKAYPQWLAQVQYDPPAFVRYTGGTQAERVFRCILRPPVGTIPTNTTYFEEVLTDAQNIARVPFVNRGEVAQGADWDNLTRGFWTVSDASILTSGLNSPPTSTDLGYLISYPFGGTSGLQMYYCQNASVYLRSRAGGGWSTWKKLATSETTLSGYGITDAVRSAGWLSESPANLNTLTANAAFGVAYLPSNWAALNYPVNESGALFVFGNEDTVTSRVSQLYLTSQGVLYSRSLTRSLSGPRTWTAWGTTLTNVQQVFDALLPRNNTWTGENTWNGGSTMNGAATHNGPVRMYAMNTRILGRNGETDAGIQIAHNAAGRNWDVMMNQNGARGFFDRDASRWDLLLTANNTSMELFGNSIQLNRSYTYAESFVQFNTNEGLIYPPRAYASGTSVGFQNTNATGSAHVFSYLDRNGDWRVQRDLRANGWVWAGNAYLSNDGSVVGSSWPGGNAKSYVDGNWFVQSGNGGNKLRVWWDGRVQWSVDGTFVGTMANTGDLTNYWRRSEFLRPDQGGWWRDGNQAGQFVLPDGGVWAWFTLGNNAQSHLVNGSSGISAGGTFIAAPSAPASILAWRIY